MQAVFVHGLGQTPAAWNEVVSRLHHKGQILCPDLPGLVRGREVSYPNLHQAFAEVCSGLDGQIDLCGLSLGGVLALNYAIDHPEKVRSLVLIAAQFKMPKNLLRFQNAIFRFMPKSMFTQMGFGKEGFLRLCRSMMEIDLSTSLSRISCPVLVVCGEKDAANRKAADQLAQQLHVSPARLVPGAGHEVNVEAPEELAQIINVFYRTTC